MKEQRQVNGERRVFSTNGAGKNGHIHAKNELDSEPILFTKINSKQMIELNSKIQNYKGF